MFERFFLCPIHETRYPSGFSCPKCTSTEQLKDAVMRDETTERLVNTILDLTEEVAGLRQQLSSANRLLDMSNSSFDRLQTDICNWSDKLSDKSLATELKTLVSDR